MRRHLLFAAALLLAARAAEPIVAEGEDWSLPGWVQPKPYSGFYAMNSRAEHPLIKHLGMTLTWKALNPAEGVYDFSVLEKYLDLAQQRGGMVLFRLKASVLDGLEQGVTGGERQFIPPWVVAKHHPATFHTRPDKLYAAPWNPGVQSEYRKLVLEIGRRGYLASPQFLAIYLHGISKSHGEEMSVPDERYVREAMAAGLTADVLLACWQARMDAWAEAAGRFSGKVIWVGTAEFKGLPYPREELDAYARAKGFGLRGGFIEHYFYGHLAPPVAGQSYVDGHVVSDWSAPLRDGRYFGDENEETDEFGDAKGRELDVAVRSPYFRAAQVGINYLWVTRQTVEWAGGAKGIPGWFVNVAGKGPAESPDAACWLRETLVRGLGTPAPRPWKNLERMLGQRDVPGARSVPTERYAMPYVSLKVREDPGEFTARRTDRAGGQRALAFALEPAFRASLAGPVQIKVTYLDHAKTTWTVRSVSGGKLADLGIVHGRGDGAWRTATFATDEPPSAGAWGQGMDFAIHALGDADVTVRFVRVVRLNER